MSSTTQDTEVTQLEAEVFVGTFKDAAHSVARQEHAGSMVCDVQDVEQSIWEHFTKNTAFWVNRDREALDRGDSISQRVYAVSGLMRRAASAFCRAQRHDYELFSGKAIYTGQQIKQALDKLVWVSASDVSTHTDDFASRLDVIGKLKRLPASQRNALYRRHGKGEQLPTSALRTAAAAGVRTLVAELNGAMPGGQVDLVSEAGEPVA